MINSMANEEIEIQSDCVEAWRQREKGQRVSKRTE